jgi:methyl-accepting chemotaxis protein
MSAPATRHRLARIAFAPVYFFIERVRFARSLLLLLLLLPDGYVAYLLVKQTSKDVDFSAKESVGVAYITPVRKFLATLQRLRVVAYGGVEGPARAEVLGLTQLANGQVADVEAAEAAYGAELETTAIWRKALDGWTDDPPAATAHLGWHQLQSAAFPTPQARDQAFADLTGYIFGTLIAQAGNNSNLILDPDLDSYWMMDVYLAKLPNLGELVATAGTASIGVIADGALTNEERADLAGTLGVIASNTSDLINSDLKTALDDNEKFNEGRQGNGRLRPVLKDHFDATAAKLHAFTDALRDNLLYPAVPRLKAAELSQRAAQLIDEIHALQLAVGPELDRLCVERADRYRRTRGIGIWTFIGAALLISYVFNGFTSQVKESQERIVEEHGLLQEDIRGLLTVVSNAAEGDLTARAKVGDGTLGNVADAFNQMMESWQELIAAITLQLDRTNQAVAELRGAAATMATGASRQAHEVLAATTAVQRMSDEITRVSGNADSAAAAAQRTQESALQGSSSVQDVVQGMDTLRALVQAGAKKIKSLGDRSMEITSIVGTIAKISEQTNMLALNAAIEAARAGDQGRGFSVVADEVRKLAERTANATQEIDKLVRTIQTETTESVGAIERQTLVVEEEGRAVATAGSALTRIKEVSSQSTALVTDIASTARTQVTGAQSVVGTMQRISAIAQDTERSAQGSLDIAQGLGQLSEQLRSSIGRFRT